MSTQNYILYVKTYVEILNEYFLILLKQDEFGRHKITEKKSPNKKFGPKIPVQNSDTNQFLSV